MWRRPQNNPAVPVPTYYPDDGADSHLHSPRRKSYVGRSTGSSGVPLSSISGTLTSHSAPQATFPLSLSSFQNNPGISSSGSVDPFGEAAYQEWVSSMGLHQQQQQHTVEPQAIWPSTINRDGSKHLGSDASMPKIPDYLSPIIGQAFGADPMGLSGPSLEDDSTLESLKVPTNTPTTLPDGNNAASGLSGLWYSSLQCLANR